MVAWNPSSVKAETRDAPVLTGVAGDESLPFAPSPSTISASSG